MRLKILLIGIIVFICVVSVNAVINYNQYDWVSNPDIWNEQDLVHTGNFSGDNLTADKYFFSNGDTIYDIFENSTGVIKAKSPQNINIQEKNINNVSNITADNYYYQNGLSINETINQSYVPYSGAYKNVDLGANNFTVNTNTFLVDSTTGRVLIDSVSGYDPRIGLSVSGDFDVDHIATENDDHAVEIDVDAAGFGDVKGINIVYTTGAIVTGKDEEAILINIDESLAIGGDVVALEVLATEGSAGIYGLEAGALVNPVIQLSGTFIDMDSANNSGLDNLSNFISSADDHPIFVNDDDYVTIGDANKFEEIEFLLDTTSSNPGIKPTFEFSTGIDAWTEFSPADGTNGMRNTGIIAWLDEDIPTWDTGAGTEYLIRITRTQNNLQRIPIEDKVQIVSVVIYKWDKNGDLVIREVNATTLREGGISITTDTELDNGSIVRSHNTSWITDNQNINTSTEMITAVSGKVNSTSWNSSKTNYVILSNINDKVSIGNSSPEFTVDIQGNFRILSESFYENSFSPDINAHQGYTRNGTTHYIIGTNNIYQRNSLWNTITSNPTADDDAGVNHLGDGDFYNDRLYISTMNWSSCTNDDWNGSQISVFDAIDLSIISNNDISDQNHDSSGSVVVPEDGANGIIYVVAFCNGTSIWRYDLNDISYLGAITLSEPITSIQGITHKNGDFYVNSDDNDSTYKITKSGLVLGIVYTSPTPGFWEGLDFSEDELGVLLDENSNERIRFLEPRFDITNLVVHSGKVGIGTDSPSHTLDVKGDANFSGAVQVGNPLTISSGGYKANLSLNSVGFLIITVPEGIVDFVDAILSTLGDILGADITATGTVQGEHLISIDDAYITNNLDVGGNANIAGDLNVSGNTLLDGDLNVTGTSYLSGFTISDDLIVGNINISGTTNRIGIGTTTPSSALEVVGNANITGNITSGSGTICNATICYTLAQLNTTTDVSGYVPYTGATSDVDLGSYDLLAGNLTLVGHNIILGEQTGIPSANFSIIFKGEEEGKITYQGISGLEGKKEFNFDDAGLVTRGFLHTGKVNINSTTEPQWAICNEGGCFIVSVTLDGTVTIDSSADVFDFSGDLIGVGGLASTGEVSGGNLATAGTISDGVLTISDGSLTSAIDGTFSGTVTANSINSSSWLNLTNQSDNLFTDSPVEFKNVSVAGGGVGIYKDSNNYGNINTPLVLNLQISGTNVMTMGAAQTNFYQRFEMVGDGTGHGIRLGGGRDAEIYYSNANLIINPDRVGTGSAIIEGNSIIEGALALGTRGLPDTAGDLNASTIHYAALDPDSPHMFLEDSDVGYTTFCVKDELEFWNLIYWSNGTQKIKINSSVCFDKFNKINPQKEKVNLYTCIPKNIQRECPFGVRSGKTGNTRCYNESEQKWWNAEYCKEGWI